MTVLLFAGLSSCASLDKAMTGTSSIPTPEQKVQIVKQFPELSAKQREQFISGSPWVGMSQTQLDAYMGAKPGKSQRKISSAGAQDILLYAVRAGDWKTGIQTKYFKATMLDGKVSEFQEIDGTVGSLDKL